jgi:hypothetical protein
MGRMIGLALLAIVTAAPMPAAAETAVHAAAAVTSSDISAQRRPRIRVTPGRLLYRECTFRLVQEWRPSGTVIVPRQRCWWVRG